MGISQIHSPAFICRSNSNRRGNTRARADYSFMDDATLTAAFHAHADGETMFTRRMVILIADMASMRPMALVWRLEKMGLVKQGSWCWFRDNGGIKAHQVKEVLAERDADIATTSSSDNLKDPITDRPIMDDEFICDTCGEVMPKDFNWGTDCGVKGCRKDPVKNKPSVDPKPQDTKECGICWDGLVSQPKKGGVGSEVVACPHCRSSDNGTCKPCKGTGRTNIYQSHNDEECFECKGTGQMSDNDRRDCDED